MEIGYWKMEIGALDTSALEIRDQILMRSLPV